MGAPCDCTPSELYSPRSCLQFGLESINIAGQNFMCWTNKLPLEDRNDLILHSAIIKDDNSIRCTDMLMGFPPCCRLMRPDDANIMGNVHGGIILKMIEEAGGIVGTRHCNTLNGVNAKRMSYY